MPTPTSFVVPGRAVFIGAVTLALAGLGAFAFSSTSSGTLPETAVADAVLAADTFRPTSRQWESLRVAAVEALPFRTELHTEGMVSVNGNTTANVFSPFSGRVSNLPAKVGDTVRRGDPLMTVEASEFVQGYNDLITALNEVNAARAQLALAKKTESRERELHQARAGALKEWLRSQTELAVAQAGLRTAETALNAARNRLFILGKTEKEIAALERATKAPMKAEAIVGAPIAGTVVERKVGFGQFLQSATDGAAEPAFSIADLSTVWLVGYVRETDVAAVRVGQPVQARVLSYPDRVFEARVTWVSPTVDPATYRVPVRAEIENLDGALKPMMFANFTIQTGDAVVAPAVPKSAVIHEGSATRLYVAHEDGTVQTRAVELGRAMSDMVEVTAGVAAGERVVVGGALFVDRATQGS